MKATDFEFRHRFGIITAIFVVSLSSRAIGDESLARDVLGWLRRWPVLSPGGAGHALFGLGALLALLCALVRTWAAAYLRSPVVHDRQMHTAHLVADGPYRHLRNPLYLGVILLAFAFAPMAGRVGAALLVVGIVGFVHRLIRREETELLRARGDAFRRYCESVPRLLPSLVPRVPSSGDEPRWLQGLVGETMMWGFFLTLAGFAWTRSYRAYGYGMAVALASSAIVKVALLRLRNV